MVRDRGNSGQLGLGESHLAKATRPGSVKLVVRTMCNARMCRGITKTEKHLE